VRLELQQLAGGDEFGLSGDVEEDRQHHVGEVAAAAQLGVDRSTGDSSRWVRAALAARLASRSPAAWSSAAVTTPEWSSATCTALAPVGDVAAGLDAPRLHLGPLVAASGDHDQVAPLTGVVGVFDAEGAEWLGLTVGVGWGPAFVDGPAGCCALVEQRLAVLGGVGCFGGALQAPVEIGAGAVVVGQDGVDDVGPVGVLGDVRASDGS
jgi:hypothetical protein